MNNVSIEGFQLSPQQKRVWIGQQKSWLHPTQSVWRIEGPLHADLFRRALATVIDRHEILRTVFRCLDGMEIPIQVLTEEAAPVCREIDLEGDEPAAQQSFLRRLLHEEKGIGFDLENGPLVRFALLRLGRGEHRLAITSSALCADGRSHANLAREIAGLCFGTEPSAAEGPIQYVDFAEWQNELLESDELREARAYWRKQSGSASPAFALPFENPQGDASAFAPGIVRTPLAAELAAGVRSAAERLGASLEGYLLTTWLVLLRRYAKSSELVLGRLHHGRKYEDLERGLGLFATFLPFAASAQRSDPFDVVLGQVRRSLQEAEEWTEYFSWEALADTSEPDGCRLPFCFELEELPAPENHGEGRLLPLEASGCLDLFQLKLKAVARPRGGLELELHYDTALYPAEAVERLVEQYAVLLRSTLEKSSATVAELDLLSPKERDRFAADWRPEASPFPSDRTVHRLFEERVERWPDRLAVAFEDESLSYAELQRRANRLARSLRRAGVGAQRRVVLMVERSADQAVGLLAILKAGGAFVPVDPDQPRERLALMLEDVRQEEHTPVVLTRERWRGLATDLRALPVTVDDPRTRAESAENLDVDVRPENLAYLIFTSGSTGRPKATMITHRSVLHLATALRAAVYPDSEEPLRVSLNAPLAFDASIKQVVQWLYGHTLVLVPEEVRPDGEALMEFATRRALDVLDSTPSQLRLMLDVGLLEGPWAPRIVLVGGEAIEADMWRRLASSARSAFFNVYGPSECTVDTTVCRIAEVPGAPALGRPLANVQVAVLDARFRPVPLRMAGELCVGGSGLSRGYSRRSGRTAERFVPHPHAARPGERLYRTGDEVRYRDDGRFEFLGRLDHQVKLRGYRIELPEIEAVLRTHPAVREAVTLLRRDRPDEPRLVAYVVSSRCAAAAGRPRYELPNGMAVAHQNRNETEYLFEEIFENRCYVQHGIELPEDAVVFDVGANIGMFTLFAHQECARPRIWAFEPLAPIFDTLQINCELYSSDVRLIPCGLSHSEATERFTYYPRYTMMSGQSSYARPDSEVEVVKRFLENQQEKGTADSQVLLGEAEELLAGRFEGEELEVRLRRLSDVLREEQVEHIDLLKVDVQRAEFDVLRGVDEADWSKIDQVVMELHDDPGEESEGRSQALRRFLEERGFEVVVEQDELLVGTDRYNLYALRRGRARHATGAGRPAEARPAEARPAEARPAEARPAEARPAEARPAEARPAEARPAEARRWPEEVELRVAELREFLGERLPDYMLPSVVVELESLPLNKNGKIDRGALPAPEEVASLEEEAVAAAQTPFEEVLVAIWSELLGLERVGVDQSFFELGGHSLLATQLMARIREIFSVDLPLRTLFEQSTVNTLAERIEEAFKVGEGLEYPVIETVPRHGELPLSFGQQRLWFLQQLAPGSFAYNNPKALHLTGRLNVAALESTLNEIVRRHEVLRTLFPSVDGTAVQKITPAEPLEIPILDLSGLPGAAREDRVRRCAGQEARRPFDLARDRPLRTRLLRLGCEEHVLLLTLHHIVCDAWSLGVLEREVTALYQAFAEDRPSPLAELPIQYADYASWQRRWLEGEVRDTQLAFWKEQLAGAPPAVELPADRPRSASSATHRGANRTLRLPAELAAGLLELSRKEGVTTFMTLMAGFQVLLWRHSGQSDLSVGTPIAGRRQLETESLIGFFVNTLVLRADLSGDPSVGALLARTRERTLEAHAHQDLPFEMLVDELVSERDLRTSPLFQVSFALQNTPRHGLELPGLAARSVEVESEESKFDLTLTLIEAAEGLDAIFNYNALLFDPTTIQSLGNRLHLTLAAMVLHPDHRLSELPSQSAAERQQLLVEWNATPEVETATPCLHRLLEAQVKRSPDAVAVICGRRQLTYRELNRRANQLARHLRSLGVRPEARVGICVERSPEMLVGLLGILKAGGAYVPLDPTYPEERLSFMVGDALGGASPPVLVTVVGSQRAPGSVRTVRLDADREVLDGLCGEDLPSSPAAEHPAYVIYTSGSSGRPKGVVISHRSAVRSTSARFHVYREPVSRFLLLPSFAFDSSVAVLFWTLSQGGALMVPREDSVRDPVRLTEMVADRRISHWLSVPSLFSAVLEGAHNGDLASLSTVIVAGEACSPELVARHRERLPRAVLYNEYGPTEGTVWSSVWSTARGVVSGPVPIGRTLPGVRLYVLDPQQKSLAAGVSGELGIGGRALALGYLGRPRLSAGKFVPDPFSRQPGGRLYRTGDLVRWLARGDLDFLGRIDHQVKLRGLRIELGEIEAILKEQPSTRDAVVLAREDLPGDKRLVGYVVPEPGEASRESLVPELRAAIREHLPDFMIPAFFVVLEQWPLNPNGKVDRRALPPPDTERPGPGATFTAPRNLAEERLAAVWSEVLGIADVGVDDNFFELGGDSILSIQVVARANREGLRITPRQIFQYPTVAQLAAVASAGPQVPSEQGLVRGSVPLTPIQHLFFERVGVAPHHWNQSVLLAGKRRLDASCLREVVGHLLAHHDALRLRFERRADGWHQEVAGLAPEVPVSEMDLRTIAPPARRPALEAAAAEAQQSLDPFDGPLARFVLIRQGAQETDDRLLIVVHHLAIDAVSWRILLEDLQEAYEQRSRGEAVRLPSKTSSYRSWAEKLTEYSRAPELSSELPYWTQLGQSEVGPLPVDFAEGLEANLVGSAREVTLELDAQETQALLREVPKAYRTEINDVLLTALAEAFTEWTGEPLLLELEGHGREDLFADVDLSRTVGWFTSVYPVLLDVREARSRGEALKRVKEQLRRLPRHGIGHGVLRYLSPAENTAESLRLLPRPEVSFNYLGQVGEALPEASFLARAPESRGAVRAGSGSRDHLLEATGIVVDGRFTLTLRYSSNVHRHGTIARLGESFMEGLRLLSAHCLDSEAGGYTPSDFPLLQLSETDLEGSFQAVEFEEE